MSTTPTYNNRTAQRAPAGTADGAGVTDAYRAYVGQRYFANLNGLRFICITMVLWHHAILTIVNDIQFFGRGFLGVDFFFVLSGYLITTLLLREADRNGSFSLKNFYIRRALRILPIYFLLVTAIGAYFIFAKGERQFLELWPYYYLFLSNFLDQHITLLGVTWSLSVEEQFYLAWPLMLLVIPTRFIIPLTIGLVIANVAWALGLFGTGALALGPLEIQMFTATYAPLFLGALLAIALNNPAGFRRLYGPLSMKGADLGLFALLCVIFAFGPGDVTGWSNLLIHCLMTLALGSLVVREDPLSAPFLQNRFVARFGEVSYGIYLYHLVALHVITLVVDRVGLVNEVIILVAYSALSFIMAEISFRYYEKRFLALRPR